MKQKLIILYLSIFFTSNLFAATTGRIAGQVRDINGNPLAYANLALEAEERGTQTDAAGKYILDKVEPGKYKLICQKLGYKSHKVINLIVSIDETTVQNFNLEKAALEVEGIKISESKNKLVDKLKTSSGLAVSEESLAEIDLLEVEDLVARQAGVYINNGDLHIRGGRMNEVAYVIDGIAVSDIVDSESALAVDIDAIREMKVMTGGFPAEYGNAQSGIINIITKRGQSQYQGKVELSSDVISDISNRDMVKLMLSGPLFPTDKLRERLTFFCNGKLDRSDTYLKDNYGVSAWEEIYLYGVPVLGSYWRFYDYYDPYAGREEIWGVDIDERNSNKTNLNAKLYYEISPQEKITLAWRQDKTLYYPYDHNWRYALENYKEIRNNQTQLAATYNKALNSQMHLSAAFSYYQKKYQEHPRDFEIADILAKDPAAFNLYGENYLGETPGIIYHGSDGVMYNEDAMWNFSMHNNVYDLNEYFHSPGSYYGSFIKNQNQVFTLKTDVDLQYQHHAWRSGVEVVSHRIARDKLINPWNYDNYRYQEYLAQCTAADSIWHQVYQEYIKFYSLDDIYEATLHAAGDAHGVKAQPWQYSFYIQDKMEWEGLVVNAGLRWDGWDLGKYYQQLNDQNEYEKIKFARSERFHFMLSPRLGVSHAISEKSVLHFAFNYQNQLPRFSAIYPDATTYDIYLGNLHWGSVIMGNPQLEPQISITGEIGWQRQLAENYFADLTVYYKKSYNYLSLSQEFLEEDIYYYKYVTDDYGVSRGLDLNLQRAMFDNINASLAYSLGWAEGTSSEHYLLPQGEIEVLEQLSLQEFPLNWDTRHNLAFNLTFRIRDQEDFFLPATEIKLPFDDFLINFQYNYATGTPYTDVESYEVNNARLPDSQLANLKISKGFNLLGSSKLQVYIKWENLFNDQNINFAYITTGSPYYDGHEFESAEEQTLHEMNTKNPQNINVQREIMLGMALSW